MNNIKESIRSFFEKSSLPILFAGAGVAAHANLPTWPTYLKELGARAAEYDEYTKFFIDKAVDEGALEDAASYYMLCRQIPESMKLQGLVKPLEKFDAAALGALVKLPFKSVVTTNFDRSLFEAYAKHAGISPIGVNIDDPTLDSALFSDQFYIARIHGRVEVPQSMRLDKSSFEALNKNDSYTSFLEHVFTRRQVLFIGFSFLDPAISSVLRSVRKKTLSMHGQEHLALIPSGASTDFIEELERHSIRRVIYDESNYHEQLWAAIWDCSSERLSSKGKNADVRDVPFSVAKKYLATSYARAKVGRQREPLAQAIAEGVVSGLIQDKASSGISDKELIQVLMDELTLTPEVAEMLMNQSITALTRDGICKISGDKDAGVKYYPEDNGSGVYESAIDRLVEGAVNRYVLTRNGGDSLEVRSFLKEFFGRLLLSRGWELGASYASRRMPDEVDVPKIMDNLDSHKLSSSNLIGLARSVENLLMRPDDEEALLLAELGRTAFGLELMLEAPHDSIFLKRTLPECIYIDANVVMPAITIGHPHHQLFKDTINTLKESARGAVLDVSLRIYDGFLNEIVSHKQLAYDAMTANDGEGALWEERSVGLYGSGNVNVFVGAYFNYKEANPGISFDEFMHRAAPYNTEGELKKHLVGLGFEVIREVDANKYEYTEILHTLEKFYSGKLERLRKSAVVIRHDAAQLSILNHDLHAGVRTLLVSADKGIRFALDGNGYSSVSNAMITHLGLAQLVELLIGRVSASRGLASLLWMSPVSSDTDRIRNYLIALGLKEHDAAMAMHLSEIVDEISEDAGMELSRKKLKLDVDNLGDRINVHRTLERYEAKFFGKMRTEVEKMRNR